jgi:aminoglycoside phosphotransferase
MTGRKARSAGERDLWTALEGLGPPAGSAPSVLVSVDRRASPFASSARLEEVDLVYEDGTHRSVIFKPLGARGLLPAARLAKPRFVHDPAREIAVYRRILDRHRLGTPRYLGSVVDPRRGRYWLFLERVPGLQLRWATDDGSWDRTAIWLATLHTTLRAERDRGDVPLLVHDRAFHMRWLTRARRFSATADPSRTKRLAWIASGYHRVVDLLDSLPRTVVHGQFYPSNVLVDEASLTGRICALDWEVAGVGAAVTDLAALTAGAPTHRREAMVDAYLAAMAAGGSVSTPREEMELALTHARLALAIQWMGWSAAWSAPPEQAHDWLAEAVDLFEGIR